MDSSTVINVEQVGKKFCKSHRQAMKYGIRDLWVRLAGQHVDPYTLRQDEFWAVEDVSFTLKAGQCLGVIGPNGSGKSTLLKMLNGVLQPDTGTIQVNGKMAAMIEIGAGFHPVLTGRENIFVNGAILGMDKQTIKKSVDEIISFSGLEEFIDTPVKYYSSGMYVRLGFAIAAQLRPEILIIDEVLAVGDIQFRIKCIEHIRKLQQEGAAIILVSHNTIDILKTVTEGIVMARGKIQYSGDAHTAVEVYNRLMIPGRPYDVHSTVSKNVYINKVTVMNCESAASQRHSTGDSMKLQIELNSNRHIDDARVIVAIERPQFGIVTSISSAYQRQHIEILPGTNRLELKLESVPFLKGHYIVNVSLYGKENQDFFDRAQGAAFFEISGPELDYLGHGISGCIKVDHSWRT